MGKPREKRQRQVVRGEKEIGEVLAWAREGAKDGLAFERGTLAALEWITGRNDSRPDQVTESDVDGSSKGDDDPDEDDFV